ncbi:hypothetical protein N7495_009190 [Penicillium taxi]|uniref:uncharacterized protein n=1 Tax=Penicillium taxi TaxID=168475 RepID=UPI00254567F5|nr:uncharacterized protein N7495_009190 [Penicillium taxi]KAJ5884680.1 hypothetical protein N7495_009190 [Penicillium taxi]
MESLINVPKEVLLETPRTQSNHKRPSPDTTPPGFSVIRLEGLERWTSDKKTEVLQSISDDIRATFMCITNHIRVGTLSPAHTKPLEEVIDIIRDSNMNHRRKLERRIKRLRKQNQWIQKEYRRVVQTADTVARTYNGRVQKLKQRTLSLQEQLTRLTSKEL